MNTRILTVLSCLFIFGCGKSGINSSTDIHTDSRKLTKLATHSSPKKWSVLGVTVLKDGLSLEGVKVEFSRSISGRPSNYQWTDEPFRDLIIKTQEKTTDQFGWTEILLFSESVEYLARGTSGYYSARIVTPETGESIWQWQSIPVNDGQKRNLILEVGKPARYLSPDLENDIITAVFRHQIEEGEYSGEFYAFSLGWLTTKGYVDPSDAIVERFLDIEPFVRKVSQCDVPVEGAFDKETGKRGVIAEVKNIRWIDNQEVKTEGSVFISGLGATFYRYSLKKENGKWIVTNQLLLGIA